MNIEIMSDTHFEHHADHGASFVQACQPVPPRKPYREFSFHGWSLWVGKKDSDNDALTFDHAGPDDIWLHAVGVTGSHVVIRNTQPWMPVPTILDEAARLAKHYSKAQEFASVPVHVCWAKEVIRTDTPGKVHVPDGQIRLAKGTPHAELAVEKHIDILVAAGDIFSWKDNAAWERFAALCRKYPQVLYVPGNHELYGSDVANIPEYRRRLGKIHNVTVLDGTAVIYFNDRPILGAALWFPQPPDQRYQDQCNDFSCIRGYTPWVYEENQRHVAYLRRHMTEETIVITHYLPTARSIVPPYVNHPLNRFFFTELEELIQSAQPPVWIHGHSHTAVDYHIGKTRVVSNPLGYPGEESGYRDPLIITI